MAEFLQGTASSPGSPAAAQPSLVPLEASSSGVPISETALHPLDANPVTNEHTARMTLARKSALEHYAAGR